jgi:hypothetical protein
MSRLPVDLERTGPRHDRQAIWQALRKLKLATATELRGELPGTIALDRIHAYLKGLVAAGYVVIRSHAPGPAGVQRPVYWLERDVGVEAPRVRPDGTPVTQGRKQEALWAVLRVLREPLSPVALAAHASTEDLPVSAAHALDYLRTLAQAGYVAYVDGKYRLLPTRNSGPRPPQIQRIDQVYDPNLDRVVWRRGEAGHG